MPAPTVSSGHGGTGGDDVEPRPAAAAAWLPDAAGKRIRLRRIVRPRDGRTVIVPLDHGMIMGALPGIARPRETITAAVTAGADGLLLHPGILRHVADLLDARTACLVKLTNGASVATDQYLLGSVEQALRYAADAVCVEFHLGDPDEGRVLHRISAVQRDAERYGLPVIVHAYVHPAFEAQAGVRAWLHAARIAVELGADIVKTAYLGASETFVDLLEATPVPVIVAGGAEGDLYLLWPKRQSTAK
jgi:fructose-bisphosphate aldolase / 2-amino-3,7-dideoxy-D-threo-hept-6-ulosonate synthase